MESLNDSFEQYKKINLNCKSLQSYEKHLQRLKTFELFKWFAKPPEFSPIECSKHGWINSSKDTLKCVLCSSLFYFYTQSPLAASKYSNNSAANNVKNVCDPKLLLEKHNQNCPFRSVSVSDHLIEIDIADEEKLLKNFNRLKDTFKSCAKLPCLTENIYEEFKLIETETKIEEAKSASSYRRLDKPKTVSILSNCGWFYKKDKDTLECAKCLRTIGLWLYKRDQTNQDDDHEEEIIEAQPSQKILEERKSIEEEEKNCEMIFGNTEPYTDEIIIKNIIYKIVNSIEIEEQTSLKDVYYIDKFMTSNNVKYASQTSSTYESKKRKFDDLNEEPEYLSRIDDKKKLLDPIKEHFTWCPWLKEISDHPEYKFKISPTFQTSISYADGENKNKTKLINKNMCHVSYEIINKALAKPKKFETDESSKEQAKAEEKKKNPSLLNMSSEQILDQVKSAQSVLINCTSQFSLK